MTRHLLRLDTPAGYFCDALPIGNGSMGAMIYGRPGRERIDLNADTLWSGGPLPVPPDGPGPSAAQLPKLREIIRNRDFAAADELAAEFQSQGWTQSYQPVGWLDWDYATATATAHAPYGRELDLADAEARTEHSTADGPITVRSFVSAVDDVLVVSITGPGLAAVECEPPVLRSPHPVRQDTELPDGSTRWLLASGRAPSNVLPNYVWGDDPVTYADDEPDDAGTVSAGMGFAVVGVVERTEHEQRLIVAIRTGFRGSDERPSADLTALRAEARDVVTAARTRTTQELCESHRRDHRDYFDRVDLDLTGSVPVPGSADPARAELYFDVGRYLLISSSRPGTQAANLQGIWNVDVRPGWSSNYTTNINVQMNYWGAEPLGLADVHGPMLDLLDDLVRAGRSTAASTYGLDGSVAHHNSDLWRFTSAVNGDPVWANWPSALPWMGADLWDHLDFATSTDANGIRRALEIYRPIAAFVLAMLVPDEEGALIWSPSSTPEHKFVVDGVHSAVSEGGSMDQELSHELLGRYLDLAGRAGAQSSDDDDLVPRALAALERLRPIGHGARGQLLEWYDDRTPGEWGHRHLSHLYGVYPGTRITESGTPEDFAAARMALQIRLDNGSGYTGWSQAWVLCLAARLRDPALAEQSIRTLVDELCSPSMLDFHPHGDWPGGMIFQIDGNLGAIGGMAELLVQGHEGAISVLKTLPPSWSVGRVRGVRVRGGHLVDLSWQDGRLVEASITVGRPGTLVVELPESPNGYAVAAAGPEPVDAQPVGGALHSRQRLCWPAPDAGRTYAITPT